MVDNYPMYGDVLELVEEIKAVTLTVMADGAGSSHYGGPEGWIHGLSLTRISGLKLAAFPTLAQAIRRLNEGSRYGTLQQVMVNKLAAGKNLDRHKDGEPNHARFHLPVITHEDVYWWDEINGQLHMKAGQWYGPVPYCGILHSVENRSEIDRVHVIVDFEKGGYTRANNV